jgi:hypothetical protein
MDLANSGDMTSLTAADIYNIANKLADNAFADEILGGILADAADKWSEGQTFLGQKAPDLDADLMEGIYAALKDGKNASDTIKAVGHVYAVGEVLGVVGNNSSSSGGTITAEDLVSKDKVKVLMNNLNDDSIEIVAKVVTSAINSSITQNANLTDTQKDKIAEFVKVFLNQLKNVSAANQDGEAEKIAKIFGAVQDYTVISDMETAKDYIKCIQDSTVLMNTLKTFVEDNPNPLNVEMSESAANNVKDALSSLEITKTNPNTKDLYEIVMALFGIDD